MSEKSDTNVERKRNVISLKIQAGMLERLAHGVCN
jgi:hypothetical protein